MKKISCNNRAVLVDGKPRYAPNVLGQLHFFEGITEAVIIAPDNPDNLLSPPMTDASIQHVSFIRITEGARLALLNDVEELPTNWRELTVLILHRRKYDGVVIDELFRVESRDPVADDDEDDEEE